MTVADTRISEMRSWEDSAVPQSDTLCPECETGMVRDLAEQDARGCQNCMAEWRAYASSDWTFYRFLRPSEKSW